MPTRRNILKPVVPLTGVAETVLALLGHQIQNDYQRIYRQNQSWYRDHQQVYESRRSPRARKKFIKRWANSGLAMWDDPPQGWTKEKLATYTEGYIAGREVESGNLVQYFGQYVRQIEQLLTGKYGPRRGFPALWEIEAHGRSQLVGLWVISFKDRPGAVSSLALLVVKDGKPMWMEGGGPSKYQEFTKKAQKAVYTAMPVDANGSPAPWPEKPQGQEKSS